MSKTNTLVVDHVPRVTLEDTGRFAGAVEIRDAAAFAAALQAFVDERVDALDPSSFLEVPLVMDPAETLRETLAGKAAALRANTRWMPGETEIQRGRAMLLESFEQPHNLPLPRFARLANKSRQQIYKDIDARRLLALNVGPRGQKLPDWQLHPVKQRLVQTVLQGATGVDPWTLYRALSDPLEGLGGRSPVDAVTADSVEEVARAVFNALGIH